MKHGEATEKETGSVHGEGAARCVAQPPQGAQGSPAQAEAVKSQRLVLVALLAALVFLLYSCVGGEAERAAWSRLDAARAQLDRLEADPAADPLELGEAREAFMRESLAYARVQAEGAAETAADVWGRRAEIAGAVLLGIFGLNRHRNRTRAVALGVASGHPSR